MKLITKLILSIPAVLFGASLLAVEAAKPSYFYVEASPTYMTMTDNYSGAGTTVKKTADMWGVMFAGGYQFNQWHQVQLEAGYFSTDSAKVTYNRGIENPHYKQTIIPVLASYNFTWQFVPAWTLKVGPTVGYTSSKIDDYVTTGYSVSKSSFAYGANAAIKWDVSKRIYTQIGVKYLIVQLPKVSQYAPSNTDTLSLSAGVGYKF